MIIVNGQLSPSDTACIRADDRGLTLGDGLFETLLIHQSSIPAFDYHWNRLKQSAFILDIKLPFSKEELHALICQLIEKNNAHNQVAGVRLTVTHGNASRGILSQQKTKANYILAAFYPPSSPHADYSATIVSIKKNEHAPSSRIKSISYLDNILAKKEAVAAGFHEAILLNTESNVADGAVSTVFMVNDGRIVTPRIKDGALPGVIREILLKEFHASFRIEEKTLTVSELLAADEVFLTNALMGIQPLTRLNHRTFESTSMAYKLREVFCKEKNYPYSIPKENNFDARCPGLKPAPPPL